MVTQGRATRRLAYGGVLLALGTILFARALYSRSAGDASPGKDPALVSVARAVRGDLARSITLSAEFEPYQEVAVHAKVAGFLRSIRVDVGDRVRTGETLAELEIPEASDDLRKAAAETRAAGEDVRRAQAHYEEIHAASQRLVAVALKRPDLVAQQDIDTATAQDRGADAALASAKQRLEENAANEGRMKTMLGYGVIAAPFDGVVTRRFASPGALIQAGTASNTQAMPLVTLAQNSLLRLQFPVPETAVAYVREGTPVDVDVPSAKRSFKGAVTRFARSVDRATRTMETEVDVPNPDSQLTPGMYASVSLTLEEHASALCVPVQAVRSDTVFVVGAGGRLERRAVKVGLETPERVEVLDGVKEGDLVVVGGHAQLRSGDQVTPSIVGEPAAGQRP
jgi:RND family efflux transporter MFP subunit